jgi:hypothetical protein
MHMQRTDITFENGGISPHPDVLEDLKAESRSRITRDGLKALLETVIDEQLEAFADDLVIEEITDQMSVIVRGMLEEGLRT